jgi:TolB-like protein
MKRATIIISMVVFGLTALYAAPSIAVLDFESNDYCTAQNAVIMTDLFRNELVRSGRADIVDRRNIERIKTELRFQNSDYVNPARMRQLGQMIGAEFLMTGSFDMLGSKLHLIVQMLDIETARIAFSSRMELNNWDEYPRKVRQFAGEFISNIPLGEVLTGTWVATIEYNGSIDRYEITFTGQGRCTVKIDNGNISQETAGTYSYDGTIFNLNALFRDARIPSRNNIQWTSVLTFNSSNTAFNIVVRPTSDADQTRVTFIKQ